MALSKKTKYRIVIALAVVMAMAIVIFAVVKRNSSDASSTADSLPGILIKFQSDVSSNSRNTILSQYGLTLVSTIPELDILRVNYPFTYTKEEILADLTSHPEVSAAEANTKLTSQGGDYSILSDPHWSEKAIDQENALKISKGAGAKIGIISTGIDSSIPSIKSQILPDTYNILDGTNNVTDSSGQGTALASVIVANNPNPKQVHGVAPGAKVHIIKVSNDGTALLSTVLKGMVKSAQLHDDVTLLDFQTYGTPMMRLAYEYVVKTGDGITVNPDARRPASNVEEAHMAANGDNHFTIAVGAPQLNSDDDPAHVDPLTRPNCCYAPDLVAPSSAVSVLGVGGTQYDYGNIDIGAAIVAGSLADLVSIKKFSPYQLYGFLMVNSSISDDGTRRGYYSLAKALSLAQSLAQQKIPDSPAAPTIGATNMFYGTPHTRAFSDLSNSGDRTASLKNVVGYVLQVQGNQPEVFKANRVSDGFGGESIRNVSLNEEIMGGGNGPNFTIKAANLAGNTSVPSTSTGFTASSTTTPTRLIHIDHKTDNDAYVVVDTFPGLSTAPVACQLETAGGQEQLGTVTPTRTTVHFSNLIGNTIYSYQCNVKNSNHTTLIYSNFKTLPAPSTDTTAYNIIPQVDTNGNATISFQTDAAVTADVVVAPDIALNRHSIGEPKQTINVNKPAKQFSVTAKNLLPKVPYTVRVITYFAGKPQTVADFASMMYTPADPYEGSPGNFRFTPSYDRNSVTVSFDVGAGNGAKDVGVTADFLYSDTMNAQGTTVGDPHKDISDNKISLSKQYVIDAAPGKMIYIRAIVYGKNQKASPVYSYKMPN